MKAMKLKSCFLLIGLLLVCNVYAQELCRADFLPKASAAFDLLTQKYSEERIVKEIRAKNVRWVTNLMSASAVFYKATHEHVLEKGGKLAVLAIDPSSERSKGSILGDKTRMEQLSVHPKSFIRPSPSAGSLGGVARKTRETIVLCEAAGFDKIFVETVGVGQSETAVHSMVDFFLLIQLAGTGDELQGIKRGIMEMADGIVINKADGDNLEPAKLAASQFRNALHLFPAPESGWIPKVLTYSGFYNIGVKEIWDMVYEYIDFVKKNGYFDYRRNEQSKYWMYETINEQLRDSFYHNLRIEAMLQEKEQQVLQGNLTSFIAAKSLLDTYFDELKR